MANSILLKDTEQAATVSQWATNRRNAAQLERITPTGVQSAYIIQAALLAVRKSDALAQCDPASIIWSIIESSYVGFPVNTSQQLAYMVPYKGECQFQLGWRGLCELAMQSPGTMSVYARAVYDGDHYEVTHGTDERIVHRPGNNDRTDDRQITDVYAVIKYASGAFDFEPMTRAQVEKIRASSPGKNSPAWSDHWGEMARKCAIKRLLKRASTNSRTDTIIDVDNRRHAGEAAPIKDVIPADAFDVPEPQRITDGPSPMEAATGPADDLPPNAGRVRGTK